MPLKPQDVFTPNDFPQHSYVDREKEGLEKTLQEALKVPKTVISLSGPSKAGKTVLIEKVVGPDRLITLSGAQVKSAEILWETVLDWMGAPNSVQNSSGGSTTGTFTASAGGEAGVPLLGKATGNVSGQVARSGTHAEVRTSNRGGLNQVVKEIAGSDFVVFIDDFHYIDKDIQTDVAKQVKAAAGLGVRMSLAVVPYRTDDAVRGNAELRGRTAHVDIGFWTEDELQQIAKKGFSALG